jgi:DnaJ like chaperone protein
VRHLGDEFKAVAEEKMKEINAAYDYFKKQSAAMQ